MIFVFWCKGSGGCIIETKLFWGLSSRQSSNVIYDNSKGFMILADFGDEHAVDEKGVYGIRVSHRDRVPLVLHNKLAFIGEIFNYTARAAPTAAFIFRIRGSAVIY